jgi:outer membrane protein TolC
MQRDNFEQYTQSVMGVPVETQQFFNLANASSIQGVGSNLEVLNAESSIKESQANYFTALYNALIAKVEVEKANGTLYID